MKQSIESYEDYAMKVPERGSFSTRLMLHGKSPQPRKAYFVTEFVGLLNITIMRHHTDDFYD